MGLLDADFSLQKNILFVPVKGSICLAYLLNANVCRIFRKQTDALKLGGSTTKILTSSTDAHADSLRENRSEVLSIVAIENMTRSRWSPTEFVDGVSSGDARGKRPSRIAGK